MAEKKTTPIVIDNVEYQFEDLNEQQQVLVSHIADLDRKMASARFNLDQLAVGQQGFVQMLKQSLVAQPEAVPTE